MSAEGAMETSDDFSQDAGDLAEEIFDLATEFCEDKSLPPAVAIEAQAMALAHSICHLASTEARAALIAATFAMLSNQILGEMDTDEGEES
jgi:hypothetical protein